MKKVASFLAGMSLIVLAFAGSTSGALGRNPARSLPAESRPPSGGDLGSTGHPNTSFTLEHYQAVCQSSGKASVDVRSFTFNGHRQAFLHSEAQQAAGGDPNLALASVFRGGSAYINIPIQRPITFQLNGGDTLLVSITYALQNQPGSLKTTNFVRPESPLEGTVPLISSGHGMYSVPLGTSHGAIPKGSNLINFLFQTLSNQPCVTHTADLNHLLINGVSVGIQMDSQSCGSGCSD